MTPCYDVFRKGNTIVIFHYDVKPAELSPQTKEAKSSRLHSISQHSQRQAYDLKDRIPAMIPSFLWRGAERATPRHKGCSIRYRAATTWHSSSFTKESESFYRKASSEQIALPDKHLWIQKVSLAHQKCWGTDL
ncbi:hypothetical protein TNIN_118981 [Trichonephila inaurata madagascariensis]|uniref:Uncharacterized protein n=1 Tax=Trichonephila inaurata madagascariensis TaxID=2747483 RepID=A0A8X7CRC5_9ARAC|nr:hypothetical protein TNIN_118981 [Trichonephila inaurata madagascariensis]